MSESFTGTLGDPFIEETHLGQTYEPIAVSRREANKVKKNERITVVIGNPGALDNSYAPALAGSNTAPCARPRRRRAGNAVRIANIQKADLGQISQLGSDNRRLDNQGRIGVFRRLRIRRRSHC